MQILDPTAAAPSRRTTRAGRIENLQGLTIGLLSNRKLNADRFLSEVAKVFEIEHGCRTIDFAYKSNPSAPAPAETIEALAKQCDFMITANGD